MVSAAQMFNPKDPLYLALVENADLKATTDMLHRRGPAASLGDDLPSAGDILRQVMARLGEVTYADALDRIETLIQEHTALSASFDNHEARIAKLVASLEELSRFATDIAAGSDIKVDFNNGTQVIRRQVEVDEDGLTEDEKEVEALQELMEENEAERQELLERARQAEEDAAVSGSAAHTYSQKIEGLQQVIATYREVEKHLHAQVDHLTAKLAWAGERINTRDMVVDALSNRCVSLELELGRRDTTPPAYPTGLWVGPRFGLSTFIDDEN